MRRKIKPEPQTVQSKRAELIEVTSSQDSLPKSSEIEPIPLRLGKYTDLPNGREKKNTEWPREIANFLSKGLTSLRRI